MINLDHLNDEEREIIEAVILRDENERIREEQRVRKLKSELHQLRKKGAVKAGGEDSGDEKVCHRCRKELGFIFDSGEICPKCNNRVCNDCQVFTPSGKKWLCTVCDKQLQIKLGSPNWVGEKSDEVQSLPSLHGSQLVKVSLENSRATSAVTSVVDESEDTKRYYEDDLSYTDEESESYGSGEQDQNKSPERNVTFDSPLRQSAVPSDLETVSEESEEEEEDEDVSRSTTEHLRDDFPVPYTQQYRTQKVEADVHSNEENGSYSPPAPKQKQIIDTTPNLKGDEWEQMLNGRLKDASEKEEGKEEQVTDLTSVKMEKKEQIIQQSEEQEDKVINNDKEAADEADEKGAVGDSVKETIEDEHEKVDKVKRDVSDCGTDGLKVEEDYDDAELVVINYSDSTNEGSESREVKPVLIKEEEEGKENADLKVEMADESCQSQRNDDHGTQTEGETVDVHVDVTDDMSHTMSVKSNTSQLEPYGMDGESHSISRRNTGGTLSKVNRDDFKKASRASLVSLYSNAEESYRLQVTGDVNFGTSYNYKTNTFQVKIVSCRDLVPVDTKRNRSNPYVKLYLLPDRSKHSKRKTHVSKSTINPVYSETLKYKIRQSELETRTLCVAVWHYDRFGHNLFLGEHLLSLDTVQFDDYSAKWHPLAQRQHRSTTALTYTGDVLVAIMYEPLSEDEEKDRTSRYHKGRKNKPPGRLVGGTLHVHIKEAKNLVGMKLGGSSSPICKCYLLPDKTKHGKKKTAVKRNTCNPKWTDILKFDNVTRDSLLERCLEVTVWDFDSVGSNSLMGGVRLGLGSGKSYGKAVDWMDSSGKEVSVWREMLKHPNHWVETTMTLRGDVGKAKK